MPDKKENKVVFSETPVTIISFLRLWLLSSSEIWFSQMKDSHAMIPKEAWCVAKNETGVFPIRLQELIKTFGKEMCQTSPVNVKKYINSQK